MGSQCHGLAVLCTEGLDNLRPQHPGGTHLCHLHKIILANSPEEGQSLGKSIHRQSRFDTCTDVFQAVGQGIAQLNISRSPGLLHVVAGDGNAVELRHVLGGILENITDDAHGHFRRINISIPHHKFLQNIVLDSTGHNLLIHTLFLAGQDVESQNRQHRTVHGHGYGHLVKRYAAEQDAHVQDGVNGNPCLAYIAQHPGIIRVIAPVGRQVKGDGQALLTGSQVAAVKGIGFLRRGKACILPYCPGTEHIHGRVRTSQAGRYAAGKIQMVHVIVFIVVIYRLDRNMLHGLAGQGGKISTGSRLKQPLPLRPAACRSFLQLHIGKIRKSSHYSIIPFLFCKSCRIA